MLQLLFSNIVMERSIRNFTSYVRALVTPKTNTCGGGQAIQSRHDIFLFSNFFMIPYKNITFNFF
jgi:hypothetical protein